MKKLMIALAVLTLTACTDKERIYLPGQTVNGERYDVTLEVRECDGKLTVDFASLLIDSTLALPAVEAETRSDGHRAWRVGLVFGQ